jgi:predicted DCC family thiol-disulfide oxidoreductase YuxK
LPIKVDDVHMTNKSLSAVRPVLIFDGDCGFCTASVQWAQVRIRRLPTAQPFQFADLDALGLTRQACEQAVQFVDTDGSIHVGDQAIARALVVSGQGWKMLGRLMSLPGVRTVGAATYRFIAQRRHHLPGSSQSCDTGR